MCADQQNKIKHMLCIGQIYKNIEAKLQDAMGNRHVNVC